MPVQFDDALIVRPRPLPSAAGGGCSKCYWREATRPASALGATPDHLAMMARALPTDSTIAFCYPCAVMPDGDLDSMCR